MNAKQTRISDVSMWIDGACSGNPGPGGYASLIQVSTRKGVVEKMVGGSLAPTTSNRMELMALLAGVKALRYNCHVTVFTDSRNLIGWLSEGWKRKNDDIRDKLEQIEDHCKSVGHTLSFVKVKAHSGDVNNERVDAEAVRYRDSAE